MLSVLWRCRHDLRAQPGCCLATTCGDRRCREMGVIVVDDVERIGAAIAGALDPAYQLDNRCVVISFRRKDSPMASRLDEIVEVPEIVRELDQENLVARDLVEGLSRRAARENVKRVDCEPYVRVTGQLHRLPGGRVFADPTAPGQRTVCDADAGRRREASEHRKVLRDLVRIAAGMRRGG